MRNDHKAPDVDQAPQAVESISYGMPAYKIKGKPIAYFAAFSKHIGFYATPKANSEFTKDSRNTSPVRVRFNSRLTDQFR